MIGADDGASMLQGVLSFMDAVKNMLMSSLKYGIKLYLK